MIRWDIDPEIFRVGPVAIRYYSLMFVLGFFTMEKYVKGVFKKLGKNPELVSTLTVYIIVGTFIGARLAHCFFYEPNYYFSNPLAIFKIWEGGLASHGGFTGVLIAVFLFLKKHKDINFYWLMDIIVAPCLFVGGLIRVGNFFNSEIYGPATDLPWAVVFERIDLVPRHPTQIYEAIGYFTISFILYRLFKTKFGVWKNGTNLATAIILSFSFRFFIEFVKENESTLSQNTFINMGQMLSLAFIIFGFFLLQRVRRTKV